MVSNTIFGVITAILIILAGSGLGLYVYGQSQSSGLQSQVSSLQSQINSLKTQVSLDNGQIASLQNDIMKAQMARTPGFYNGQVVTFFYPYTFNCTPPLSHYFPQQSSASVMTGCEVGEGNATAEQGAVPLWVLVPAYAGLSIFGVQALGATSLGYPTFDNQTIITQCGASGTPSACPDHPLLLYSPFFTAVEQNLGITSGYGGLPEGVLPTPAHDHLINCCFTVIPWYTVVVLVFDPNIMPNAVTGTCSQVIPSNLTNPTQNCLSSFQNLEAALTTHSSAVVDANQNNPIWKTLGDPSAQIVIPGVATVAQISDANSNLFEHFTVNATNPYLWNSTTP
ncbi:MAG: hypothetical protein QXG05_02825 [Nitrososphaerota archaeon]